MAIVRFDHFRLSFYVTYKLIDIPNRRRLSSTPLSALFNLISLVLFFMFLDSSFVSSRPLLPLWENLVIRIDSLSAAFLNG